MNARHLEHGEHTGEAACLKNLRPEPCPSCDEKVKMGTGYRGLVIFDVDGVLFRNIFLTRIARLTGLINYLKTLLLGWRYYLNSISFDTLLRGVLGLIRNFDARKAQDIARKMRKSTNIKRTIEILHQHSYYISIMSSGIPDFILKTLCEEINADHYSGLQVVIEGGLIKTDGLVVRPKEEIVGGLLHELGLTWKNVISVVDDPNNLSLIQKSNLGIGFNPSKMIRKHADVVIDGYNFLELIPYIIPEERLPSQLKKNTHSLRRELYRKLIHFMGVPIPFLAYMHRNIILSLLFAAIVIYALSETLRYIGFRFPLVSGITKQAQRHTETSGFIIGPISLTIGILIPLLFFPPSIYLPAILIVCISDSLSGLIGKRFGRIPLPLYNRTAEGSVVFFASAFLILLFFLPARLALLTALIPTLIELFSPYNLDNLILPAATALFMRYTEFMHL